MCTMSVLCPLCAVPSFGSIDALQQRLIKAANGPLACPFPQCAELFLGLDKLTIHLFTHTSLMMMSEPQATLTSSPTAATATATTTTAAAAAATTVKRKGKKAAKHPILASKSQRDLEPTLGGNPIAQIPASCDICEFNFRNSELRDMHCRLVHENVVECNSNSITAATTTTCQEPYKCHLCAKTFKMKGSLRLHLKVVHMLGLPYVNDTPKLNICDRIRHKEANALGGSNALASATTLNGATTSTQPYALSGALSMLTQPPVPTALGSTGNVTNEAEPSTDANPKIWECDVCAKNFTTKYFLKKHKRLHTGEMPYTCQICARTFTFQQSYHKHLLYHSEIKPHVCAICGRAFKELSTLHNHERIHSGEKPFRCEVCGKCFRQRVSFLVHTRIHTGVMPYKCELCQKSFRYKVSQRTHKCVPAGSGEAQSPEQLIQAFLECNASNEADAVQHSPASAEIAAINGSCVDAVEQNEALLSQAIDDIVVESCQKLGIGALEQQQHQPETNIVSICNYNGSDSPLQQLERLRLYSPQLVAAREETPADANGVPASELFGRFLMDST
ncbi:zinc finger protein 721 [Scaptodrosophila lebanonensis]|uniref:Zinc finger protein 721 n=1 Tax=Drosophila lebanonensis TaxID=7225 RepID=A0A6J2TFE3_DROLE|nr:zinc finger protein 721 [Scaptodrosophila lebanonensis]